MERIETSGLMGPFKLTHDQIDLIVRRALPGTYALGRVASNKFHISFVGRSDSALKRELHKRVGRYVRFKFQFNVTAKASYDKECILYHNFLPPANKQHPRRSSGTKWNCPYCYVTE